jgi:hypothetical protein
MGVLRVERDAPTGIAARVGGVAWSDFDLQLFVYAVLLATLGLTMAYSNTAAQLARPLARAQTGPAYSGGPRPPTHDGLSHFPRSGTRVRPCLSLGSVTAPPIPSSAI